MPFDRNVAFVFGMKNEFIPYIFVMEHIICISHYLWKIWYFPYSLAIRWIESCNNLCMYTNRKWWVLEIMFSLGLEEFTDSFPLFFFSAICWLLFVSYFTFVVAGSPVLCTGNTFSEGLPDLFIILRTSSTIFFALSDLYPPFYCLVWKGNTHAI